LHRKVSALTKISVSQYLRQKRLQSGKELLQTTSQTVSEVAYKVGFSSTSYFIKCFHDFYGYSPGKVESETLMEKAVISKKSIAVLPFKSLSTDQDKQYLADGVMDAILLHLSKVENLRVISRTSVEQYRDTDKTVGLICEELGVGHILEGSFQKYGDEARLIVQLILPGEESHVWANEYDRNWKDIFSVQSEVAQTVASELHAVITPKEKQLIEKIPTLNMEAYDDYLRSYQYFNDLSKEALYKTIDFLNKAIEKDNGWASPYAALAQAWGGMAQMGHETQEVAGPKIFENLQKALELDPDFPNSHFVSGTIAVWVEWNWEKGEKGLLRAIALNPNDAMSRMYYSHLLMTIQRNDEALYQVELALNLDPLNPLIQALSSAVYLGTGDAEEAMRRLDKALELDPENFFAWGVMEFIGISCQQYDKVMKAMYIVIPFDEKAKNQIDKIYNEKGFHEAYTKALEHIEVLAENGYPSPVDLAGRFTCINQNEKALQWMEKGLQMHDQNLPYIATNFYSNCEIRNSSRYKALMEKLNLPMPK
ncbi:MAG: helix-turn-helix domain-containing protein, partial [Draconibacterium sp.]|nr:helix-turn-helix domain-containing protein [Draconibacterium sp.]